MMKPDYGPILTVAGSFDDPRFERARRLYDIEILEAAELQMSGLKTEWKRRPWPFGEDDWIGRIQPVITAAQSTPIWA